MAWMLGISTETILIGVCGVTLFLLKFMHNQLIAKLDEVVKSNMAIKESLAVHATKLEMASDEFMRIHDHQRAQDIKIHQIDTVVTKIDQKVENVASKININ